MKVLLLINAKSGMKNSKNHIVDVIDIFCKNGYDVSARVTQGGNDAYNYLMDHQDLYDLVCVFGGDGTLNMVSNAMMRMEKKPLLGYFPSGTMNDFASNFELGTDFKQIAERICRGNAAYFDVGKFNDTYFNYVAAFGTMCDVPFTTKRESKELLGNMAYILEGIGKLPEVKSHHITYKVNGRKYTKDILFGLIYSGNRVAGMELTDKKTSTVNDGKFNVMIVEYVPTIFNAPDVFSTLIQHDRFFHTYSTDHISLDFEEDLVWTVDGEEARPGTHADVSICHNALSILV